MCFFLIMIYLYIPLIDLKYHFAVLNLHVL